MKYGNLVTLFFSFRFLTFFIVIQGKKFIEALQSYSRTAGKNTFSLDELKAFAAQVKVAQNKNFSQFIDNLNHHNLLLNVGNKKYKLLVD